jgi:hypothetical protein
MDKDYSAVEFMSHYRDTPTLNERTQLVEVLLNQLQASQIQMALNQVRRGNCGLLSPATRVRAGLDG